VSAYEVIDKEDNFHLSRFVTKQIFRHWINEASTDWDRNQHILCRLQGGLLYSLCLCGSDFFTQELNQFPEVNEYKVFQQYGASSHKAINSINAVRHS